jgi:hypothetical protein
VKSREQEETEAEGAATGQR